MTSQITKTQIALGAALMLVGPAAHADTAATFVSGPTWSVTDALGNSLGGAQYVVLNGALPTARPAGATNYGSTAAAGWAADLSSIPGAYWVWAPGVTGATPNASLAQFSFSHQFFLDGTPTAGTISVAVDDFATVLVNGAAVGSTGSITNASVAYQAQSALATFDLLPYLTTGANTITVRAQNGPASFAGATNPTYAVNTAGVVFGGSLASRAAAVPEAPAGALLLLGLLPLGALAARRRPHAG